MEQKSFSTGKLRKYLRIIHRDLSYFFSGLVIIYAISGIMLNHRSSINPNYTVKLHEIQAIGDYPLSKDRIDKALVLEMLKPINESKNYTKYYFPQEQRLKVFLKGGSSLEVDLETGQAEYEALKKRPIISHFNRMHYNPGRAWTIFSDSFAISLIIITLTGIFINKGKKGLWGRGGIELLLGIIIPILFMIYL